MGSGGITQTKQNKKLLMNLWRALIWAFDTEIRSSMKPLPRVFNISLPRVYERINNVYTNSFSFCFYLFFVHSSLYLKTGLTLNFFGFVFNFV